MAEETPKTPRKTPTRTKKADTAAATVEVQAKKPAAAKTATKKAAATPAADKPVVEKKTVAKKPAAAKTVAPSKPAVKKALTKAAKITAEQRYKMIAEAAYYRAESCQFKSDPLRDWIEAERDITILLSGTE